ncbi:MAG: hypothetical protein A2754_02395 [Candidatus Magasanikbacteria bacterium RIFCSPHIGHO2_01_FULL_47_8]|uniref:Uncharacterized protein n=1 Tax=Candidatus Magasanikbacteria bacterium RIFCSPHIGHO2_01_FULL_47_8 TaxID=1798673 RepID=A0A1F6MCQ6_9BACT|nr:MAG: hypothetical protein A2754_02395 [Candidatus Magasanikbacteria bacterium RIFCSPHIGHO2_01_FULL_47_8]
MRLLKSEILKIIMKKFFLTFSVAMLILLPLTANAQLGGALGNLDKAVKPTGLSNDLAGSIGTIIKAVLGLVGTIFLVLTIYAGILWMTAAGKEEQIEKAKNIIRATVIGLAIVMSAYAITFFVTSRLGGASSGGVGGGEFGSSAPCSSIVNIDVCQNSGGCIWLNQQQTCADRVQ